MRWAANLALQFLLIASSNSDFVSPSTLDQSMASYTLSYQKKGATALKFHISCADCGFEQRTGRSWLRIRINPVTYRKWRWSTVLAATWQSACISSGSSSDEPIGQFLTVQIDCVDGFDARVGVTLIDQWMDFEAYKCLEAQLDTSHADEDQSKEYLEWRWGPLQDLKAKAQHSQQETNQEGKDIRKMLLHDCTGFQATWRDCRSLGCKIKASCMYVPAAIRRVRYRFGPFLPPLPGRACPWYSGCNQNTEESTLPPEAEQYMERSDTSHEDLHSPLRSDDSILSTPEQVAPIREPNISPLFTAKYLARICLVVIIVGLIIALIFRICRNTMYCRRRQVDRATRREERRARLAYRSAARRYRWQQWWERRTQEPDLTPSLDHNLPVIRQPEPTLPFETDSSPCPESGLMQAELQDFGRALEYVGELVGQPSRNLEETHPSRKEMNPKVAGHLDVRSKTPNSHRRLVSRRLYR